MIVITIRMEAEKKGDPTAAPVIENAPGVNVELDNTQIAHHYSASLRPGESVEHRLHLSPSGVLDLHLLGWVKS